MSPEAFALESIPDALVGQRLDRVVAMVTGLARADAAELVAAGAVRVGGQTVTRGSRRMVAGEVVEIAGRPEPAPGPLPDPGVAVTVVHEDDWLVVVDKPAGLVVHPGAGNATGTLVNGLLARYPEMAVVGDPARPGVVHRLDKGTSGLLVVARTTEAHVALVRMLADREVHRSYLALVTGNVKAAEGVIDAPVGRSARRPTRMAVTTAGRGARTRYRVVRRYPAASLDTVDATLLECTLETGRTHQIRVHLAAIGHPVAGDPGYGVGAVRLRPRGLSRPFLHAHQLSFEHPSGGGPVAFTSPLPAELGKVLEELDASGGRAGAAGR